ncbi:hypothetical protein MAR_001744 [Mya arenaria]|uniref:Uncharacterized protein n=1 Tax=Mya arenaria TaxID=6604 RepID=A0ABY7FG21_MYAAR|nr:hypothetical protein MAR_001744 [Mya arenaria]
MMKPYAGRNLTKEQQIYNYRGRRILWDQSHGRTR